VVFLRPKDVVEIMERKRSQDEVLSRITGGTRFFRDEALVAIMDANPGSPLGFEFGCKFDSASATMTSLHSIRPLPPGRSDAWSDEWSKQFDMATSSKDGMREFLRGWAAPGESWLDGSGHVLEEMAEMYFELLKKEDLGERWSLHEASASRLLTLEIWDTAEREKLFDGGSGILFPGGLVCPKGSPWEHDRLEPVIVVEEPGMGVGVKAAMAMKDGAFLGLYAGPEADESAVRRSPPCRHTVRVVEEGHGGRAAVFIIGDKPMQWCLENNVAGPYMNTVHGHINVRLDRSKLWRSSTGILYAAMYAIGDIAEGEYLHWQYTWRSGAGGVYSFEFN
jgi:hypothetical protein